MGLHTSAGCVAGIVNTSHSSIDSEVRRPSIPVGEGRCVSRGSRPVSLNRGYCHMPATASSHKKGFISTPRTPDRRTQCTHRCKFNTARGPAATQFTLQVKSSLYINNRQPYGSLSNVLRRPAVVEGSGWAEMTEGFHLEATRHRVLTYVPSEKK